MALDVEILARLQFAFTIMFHYIFPPLSIGLGWIMVWMEVKYHLTKNPVYEQMARFWTKIFAVNFAMGVVSGIVMEFQFGTNWAAYSGFVGDVFGSALAAWIVVVLAVLAIANIPRNLYLNRPGWAFISSAAALAALTFLFAIALFPNMVLSSVDPAHHLDIYNAASSQKTLGIILTITALGMPVVLAYTTVIYWTFRGKVQLGAFSY